MRSVWIVTTGHTVGLEEREIPVPEPAPDEVVIKVYAAGLNRGELIAGSAVHGGTQQLGGKEASGVIHALGRDVTGWRVGDRVMGRSRGTFAAYAVMYAGQLMPVPSRLSWEQAAAVPSSFLTSYEALVQHGGLRAGEWVLVAGATSGVGLGSIQTAQALGARTIGTSQSARKLAQLEAIGLDVGILTGPGTDLAQAVRDATGGQGANLAINLVGGSMFPQIVNALSFRGRLAIVGYVDGCYRSEIDLNTVHVQRLQMFGIANVHLRPEERFETTRGFVRDVLPAIEEGRITPLVDSIYSLDDIASAKQRMDANAAVGKIVVRVHADDQ